MKNNKQIALKINKPGKERPGFFMRQNILFRRLILLFGCSVATDGVNLKCPRHLIFYQDWIRTFGAFWGGS